MEERTMKDNREGQTHFQLPIDITDSEIEAIEEAVKLMRHQHFYNLMKEDADVLQAFLDRINKKV